MPTLPNLERLDLTESTSRRELAEEIHRILQPFVGRISIMMDPLAIQILAMPKERQLFVVPRTYTAIVDEHGNYSETRT